MNTVRSIDRYTRVVELDDGTIGTVEKYMDMNGRTITDPDEAFTIVYSIGDGLYTYALMFDQYVPLH